MSIHLADVRTSDVAVRCLRSSLSSRASRATSASSPVGGEMEGAVAFGALRRCELAPCGVAPWMLRRTALERPFIAFPVGLGVSYPVEGTGWKWLIRARLTNR